MITHFVAKLYRFAHRAHLAIEADRKSKLFTRAPNAVLYPSCRIHSNNGPQSIVIGAESRVFSTLETLGHGGSIVIGENCFLGEGSYIWSAQGISIGDRVLISHGVNIHDHISHSLSASDRASHFSAIFSTGHPKALANVPSRPIRVDDDVWIGFGATILKGVTIGRGAVIGAGALITKDVPEFAVMVGSPARQIGTSSL